MSLGKSRKSLENETAMAAVLKKHGIDEAELPNIVKVISSQSQALIKNDAGEPEIVDMEHTKVILSPSWEAGPQWPLIQQAKPTVIKPLKAKMPARTKGEWHQAVILPDPQIGFREFDGELDPFHDERALSVALQVMAYLEEDGGVDLVVNLGDFLDLPAQGKYEQEAAFQRTTQPAIDRGHEFLAEQRANCPDAKIVVLEGNHDRRMQKFVQANALSAFGLKQANIPESWPVMSLPFLLRLDELDIEYTDGWPAASFWINDKLRAIHGDKVRSNGSTAAAYTNDMPHISTVFGHIHRQEIQSKTTFDRAGKIKVMAISPGCLCRVDGAVPSVKGAVGIDGKPVTYYENWQQGVAVVTYKPEGSFHVELVHIDDGKTMFRGQEFQA